MANWCTNRIDLYYPQKGSMRAIRRLKKDLGITGTDSVETDLEVVKGEVWSVTAVDCPDENMASIYLESRWSPPVELFNQIGLKYKLDMIVTSEEPGNGIYEKYFFVKGMPDEDRPYRDYEEVLGEASFNYAKAYLTELHNALANNSVLEPSKQNALKRLIKSILKKEEDLGDRVYFSYDMFEQILEIITDSVGKRSYLRDEVEADTLRVILGTVDMYIETQPTLPEVACGYVTD